MTLATLLRSKDWKTLEQTWSEQMAQPGPIDDVLILVDAAADQKQITRVLPLVREHAEFLEAADRHADAVQLLGRTLLAGGAPGELSARLFRCAEAAWSEEPWWPEYTTMADFHASTPDVRKAWRALHALMRVEPGVAVFHRSGWGVGEVTELDREKLEAKVRFASGRRDWFPLKTIMDTCEVLDDEDLRGLLVRDPDELGRRLKEEPVEVLASLLRRYGGRTNQTVLKTALSQLGVEGTAFTSWWRRTRKLAETSEWIEVTGSGPKTQITLLDNAADPADSLKRQLRRSRDLAAALTRVRDLTSGGKLGDDLRVAAHETLEELASHEGEPEPHRLATWIYLRSERGDSPAPLAERVQAAVEAPAPDDMHDAPALWALFDRLPGLREQEACLDLLREARGETWTEDALANLFHTPPGLVRPLLEALLAEGHGERLAEAYVTCLVRPARNPHLFIGLAELAERGQVEGEFPPPLQRLHSLLTLAGHLFDSVGDPFRQRASTRLVNLLSSGKPSLLSTLMKDAGRPEIRALMPLLARGVEPAIDRIFTHVAVARFPDIYRDAERQFWMDDAVLTTRKGLERKEAELKDLRENKIPANSEAIGRAASYGDLSENSEWESAMEEQRTLTARAMEIEESLRNVQLLETAPIPEGMVAPGTMVNYRDSASGEVHEISLLGPWDDLGDGVISYRSPLAQGLLGAKPGEKRRVTLPTGEIEVEVVATEPLPLGD